MSSRGPGLSDLTGGLTDIFGSSEEQTTSKTGTRSGTTTKQLQLDDAAIGGIIKDILGGAQGLASIFSGEQATGLYGSSVAAQEAGDLASKLVAELAKITGKEVTEEDYTETTTGTTETSSGGLIDQVGSVLGGLF